MGTDLSEKEAESERQTLKLTMKEVRALKEETECASIEEYVIELGENTNEFQLVFMDVLGNTNKSKDVLIKLRDLWVEINVLHKTAVFLR